MTPHLECLVNTVQLTGPNICMLLNGFNPIALRMAKTQWSFGHSECSRVNKAFLIMTKYFILARSYMCITIYVWAVHVCPEIFFQEQDSANL